MEWNGVESVVVVVVMMMMVVGVVWECRQRGWQGWLIIGST